MTGSRIDVARDDRGVVTVTLDRPEVRNAFDAELIAEVTELAAGLAVDDRARVVVLTGRGEVFSAGADLTWMRSMADWDREANLADANQMADMFAALDALPQPLVGRVNGPAIGGGAGLVAVCDVAVATAAATFAFTEVRLGLAPAVISPFVVRKVGRSFARAMFVTGERFDAREALRAGLVHRVVDLADLDTEVAEVVRSCLQGGPVALAVAKRLPDLASAARAAATTATVGLIADLRVGEEGQEGMRAFFDRRRPAWRAGDDDGER